MKKMLSMMLLVALVLTAVTSVASAGTEAWGSKVIYCQPNAEECLRPTPGLKGANAGRLYVRHYLYGDFGGEHTNYFRATAITSQGPHGGTMTQYGGNWMAPNTANFVSSSSLGLKKYMTPWARGNTNYGLNRIEISGYFDPDA